MTEWLLAELCYLSVCTVISKPTLAIDIPVGYCYSFLPVYLPIRYFFCWCFKVVLLISLPAVLLVRQWTAAVGSLEQHVNVNGSFSKVGLSKQFTNFIGLQCHRQLHRSKQRLFVLWGCKLIKVKLLESPQFTYYIRALCSITFIPVWNFQSGITPVSVILLALPQSVTDYFCTLCSATVTQCGIFIRNYSRVFSKWLFWCLWYS